MEKQIKTDKMKCNICFLLKKQNKTNKQTNKQTKKKHLS